MATDTIYVAACGKAINGNRAGVQHERCCQACREQLTGQSIDGWHETYSNVTALGRWLLNRRCFDEVDLQRYYESPWNWTDEYREMLEERANGPAREAAYFPIL